MVAGGQTTFDTGGLMLGAKAMVADDSCACRELSFLSRLTQDCIRDSMDRDVK